MKGEERRKKIIDMLSESTEPIKGSALSEILGVTRQVIVQDIALLRAQDYELLSTTKGYVLVKQKKTERVFKVIHTEDQVAEEMNLIVDYGGVIEDVFVFHKIYGKVQAKLAIRSRIDVDSFVKDLSLGKSSLLMNVTSGYHYHTVSAPSVKILDLIQKDLDEKGFLAKLTDYEPVDFWSKEEKKES